METTVTMSHGIAIVPLFVLLLIVTMVIVGLIFLSKKFGAKVLLVPLILGVALFGFFVSIPHPISTFGTSQPAPHAITPIGWDAAQVPTIWQSSIAQQFETDVCTSTKPWLDNLSGYLNQHPHQDFVVAYSYDSCTNQGEASQQALHQARQLVQQRLAHVPLPDHIDLNQNGIIQDRFTQRLRGSTSDIWRSALLLDLSPARINPIAHRIQVQTRLNHNTWARQIASGLGLGFVLFLLYLFLNAATRGYYTVSLRVATAVLVVAGIAIVVWVF